MAAESQVPQVYAAQRDRSMYASRPGGFSHGGGKWHVIDAAGNAQCHGVAALCEDERKLAADVAPILRCKRCVWPGDARTPPAPRSWTHPHWSGRR